jgi:hypothetical protein
VACYRVTFLVVVVVVVVAVVLIELNCEQKLIENVTKVPSVCPPPSQYVLMKLLSSP